MNILVPFFILDIPKIIGHRGASSLAPENALIAISTAVKLKAKWVEVDVRLSADKVPIIFHDETLNRTTNAKGLVNKFTPEFLKTLDAGSWFDKKFMGERIPTLQETINHCLELNLGINIEIKPNSDEERKTVSKTLSIVNKNRKRLQNILLFSSFNLICMEELLKLAPEWPRGLLIENLDSNWEYYAKNSNVIH